MELLKIGNIFAQLVAVLLAGKTMCSAARTDQGHMDGFLKDAQETLQRVFQWTEHTCRSCQGAARTASPRCLCWDSNRVFIRLNRLQCHLLTSELKAISSSLRDTPPVAPNAAQELRRVSRMAEVLVEECRCTQWLLKALELTVGAEYFLEILRDVLHEAWSGRPSDQQKLLVRLSEQNQLDRDDLSRRLEELISTEPSTGDISTSTHGDLARFLKRKLLDGITHTGGWYPPELSKFSANINELDIQVRGEGGSARVADLKLLGKAYALKMPASRFLLDNSDFPEFKKEADILEKCRNPHLVRFIGYWNVKGMPFIVEERMDLDLEKLIEKVVKRSQLLSPLEVTELLLPVAKVMRYLHGQEIAHRDLKPGNIMCCLQRNLSLLCSPLQDITIKLIDLGEAAVENVSRFTCYDVVGTTDYVAPEVFQRGANGALDLLKADVFSFGVLLLHVSTGLIVRNTGKFSSLRCSDYKNELMAGKRPKISAPITEELKSVIERCWAHDPRERPSFDVICMDLCHISRLELSRDRRKSFMTQWLRNARMHMCLHSMPCLIGSISRPMIASFLIVAIALFLWTCATYSGHVHSSAGLLH